MIDKNTKFAVDNINSYFDNARNTMPATSIDPPCHTPEFEAKVAEYKVILIKEPGRLMNADIRDIAANYANKELTRIDLGQAIHNYFDSLAESQARERAFNNIK